MRELTTLNGLGYAATVLDHRVAVLPFGGRVIGLSPNGHDNVLWVNPRLSCAQSARCVMSDPGWVNIGGDRTWISPEIDVNVSDPSHFKTSYLVPKAMDPAAYELVDVSEDSLTCRTIMHLWFHRPGRNVALSLTKKIVVLRDMPLAIPAGVSAAGYALEIVLESLGQLTCDTRPGIWNLIQLPGGGEIVVPLKPGPPAHSFIGDAVLEDSEFAVRCVAKTAASFKFGVSMARAKGLLAYLRPHGTEAWLVVRRFVALADNLYADVPCDDQQLIGYAAQCYVNNGSQGGFCELEHHSPALDCRSGNTQLKDRSELWAFVGPIDAVKRLRDTWLASV